MSETFGEIIGSLALEPVAIPAMPDKLPVLNVTLEKFEPMTIVVIDNFEGGYYHPDMKRNFKPSDQKKLGDSGETMFGEDRKHGSQLSKYPEWKEFWGLVDADRVKNPGLWKYQYRGGKLEGQLKKLTAAIMYKWFRYLAGKYILISSMDEIANDNRLMIHFSYASWNGEGWFERYAKALNVAIKQYEGDKEMIFKTAIKARTESSNPVIRQQGNKMMNLFKRMKLL
jgi:hypothetical protein